MNLANFTLPKEFFIEGSLGLHRNELLRKFSLLLNIFMLPLAGYWLFNESALLGVSLLLFLLCFNTNVLLSLFNRPFLIAYPIVMATLALTLFLAVYSIGFSAALWIYPIIIAIYFIVPLKGAIFSNLMIALPIVALVGVLQDLSIGLRYAASITATFTLGIYLINTIVDLQQQLLEQAIKDPLTGAFNRRQMDNALSEIVERRAENSTEQDVILMIDIDYFKNINDNYGHDIGDIALKGLVKLLQHNVRKNDDVFRMGGEEFVVLLRNTGLGKARDIAESLRVLIENALIEGMEHSLSVSVGLSSLHSSMSYSQWLKEADDLLYQAKKNGRNQVVTKAKNMEG